MWWRLQNNVAVYCEPLYRDITKRVGTEQVCLNTENVYVYFL